MNLERFERLAEAYGGDIARWPVETREAAALFMAGEPDHAAAILAANAELDFALDAWRPPRASGGLEEAILAAAPAARRRPGFVDWLWRAGAGAGLAAACAAGLVLGVAVSDAVQMKASDEVVSAALVGYDELSGVVGEGVS